MGEPGRDKTNMELEIDKLSRYHKDYITTFSIGDKLYSRVDNKYLGVISSILNFGIDDVSGKPLYNIEYWIDGAEIDGTKKGTTFINADLVYTNIDYNLEQIAAGSLGTFYVDEDTFMNMHRGHFFCPETAIAEGYDAVVSFNGRQWFKIKRLHWLEWEKEEQNEMDETTGKIS